MRRAVAVGLAAAALLAAACGGDDAGAGPGSGIAVRDAWARTTPPGVSVGAVYLTVTGDDADELVGADVDPSVAATVQLHRTAIARDGGATMEEHAGLPVPAGGELVLEPIGDHLMLVDLAAPLVRGATFDITLRFAAAGEEQVEVEVRDAAP